MSPDDVAKFCTLWQTVPWPKNASAYRSIAQTIVDLKKHTPAQFSSDLNLLENDYRALGNQTRIMAQLKDEMDAAEQRIDAFSHQICDVH